MADNGDYIVGVDIGGSHIACCAVDLAAGRTEGRVVDMPVDSKAAKRDILRAWSDAISAVVGERAAAHLTGIGFAMPGPFDYRTGVAKFAGTDKFESLFGVHVETELRKIVGVPAPMRFINDATAFAIGTAWRGAAKSFRRSIAVTLGTGIGSAFIEDGIPVVSRDDVAEHGCVWHLPFRDGIVDDYISTRWFEKEYLSSTGNTVNGVRPIAEEAGKNPDVAAIFRRFGSNLGEVLAPWVDAFQAEALIFGGNVAAAMALFAPALNAVLSERGVSPAVEVCPLGDTAALLGAARLFDDGFWQRVSGELPTA